MQPRAGLAANLGLITILAISALAPVVGAVEFRKDMTFEEVPVPPAPDYADPAAWAALPETADFADYAPEGLFDRQGTAEADVFYVHPTTYLDVDGWNAAIDRPNASERLGERTIKHQATAFNECCRVYAPRYRQTGPAVAVNWPEGRKALSLAYGDVRAAFAYYLEHMNGGRPFIIVGHSQGSRHATRLLQDVIDKDEAVLKRFVAAYIIGNALPYDIYERTMTNIKPCLSVADTRCVVSYGTFLNGADTARPKGSVPIELLYGETWEDLGDKSVQCTNPMTWTDGDTGWAPAHLHHGGLTGALGTEPLPAPVDAALEARCQNGRLFVRMPEDSPFAKLHINGNFHMFDVGLFFVNLRENATARVKAHVLGAIHGRVFDPKKVIPEKSFAASEPPAAPDYASELAWAARPSRHDYADFSLPDERNLQAEARADVFYIHPTTFLTGEHWNGPIDDPVASVRIDFEFIKHQASAFNGCCRVYAPRYRQGGLWAFRPESGDDGPLAIDLAFEDLKRAFAYYLEHDNAGRPFILAGHSQGGRHGLRLLTEVLASHPARERLVAAYLIGSKVPLDQLAGPQSFKACVVADDLGCIISWDAFGEDGQVPADRLGSDLLCTNPLAWDEPGRAVPASANLGSLARSPFQEPLNAPDPAEVGARCEGSVLRVSFAEGSAWRAQGDGNSYHVGDVYLFYVDLRRNANARVAAYFADH